MYISYITFFCILDKCLYGLEAKNCPSINNLLDSFATFPLKIEADIQSRSAEATVALYAIIYLSACLDVNVFMQRYTRRLRPKGTERLLLFPKATECSSLLFARHHISLCSFSIYWLLFIVCPSTRVSHCDQFKSLTGSVG